LPFLSRGTSTSHAIATSVIAPPKTKMVKVAIIRVVCRIARLSVICVQSSVSGSHELETTSQ